MFKIRPFEAKTLSWWYSQRRLIDFSPAYQRRGGIWSKESKSYLIDSILNDFDIPKVYVADFSYLDTPLNEANKQYAIIDGRQRLEAIFEFYTGEVLLAPDFVYYDDPSLRLGGLALQDLKESYPEVADKFETYNLSVMSVITDDRAKINELFVRLNTSRPLTAPEYRNAMRGVVPTLIREISEHDFFHSAISFKTDRAEDKQVAAKFLLVEFRGELVDTKRAQLDRLVDEATKANAPVDDFELASTKVVENLDAMAQVFTSRDPLLRSQGPLVVYYWLVRQFGGSLDIREFLVSFEALRTQNREIAKDPNGALAADPELLRYDSLNRSINDVGSLVGRFQMLAWRYIDWVEERGFIKGGASVNSLSRRKPRSQ